MAVLEFGWHRKDLLDLLRRDPEVRQCILEIVAVKAPASGTESAAKAVEAQTEDLALCRLEALKNDFQAAQTENKQLIAKQQETEQSLQRCVLDFRTLEQQHKALAAEHRDLQSQALSYREALEAADIEQQRMNAELQKMQQRYEHACRQSEKLLAARAELEQVLQQRFAEGWELYQRYHQSVSTYIRGLLKGVFPQDDFEAFIAGMAQDAALPRLWDSVREALSQEKDNGEADTLWDIFTYSVRLVNKTKAQALYAIEEPAVGDKFDTELHGATGDSRAQGSIQEVCLPGFRNIYNGKILRKSMVRL